MASPDCKVQKVGAVWQFEGDGSPGGGVGENGRGEGGILTLRGYPP